MPPGVDGMTGWEVFDAVLTPDDLILLMSWRTRDNAESFEKTDKLPSDATMSLDPPFDLSLTRSAGVLLMRNHRILGI